MSKKTKVVVILTFMVSILAVLSIVFASCSNNSLANTTWQDTDGTRTITFSETTVRWTRKDTGVDLMGTYTITKDAVVLTFDESIYNRTGSLISGNLSFSVDSGIYRDPNTAYVEVFHRVR